MHSHASTALGYALGHTEAHRLGAGKGRVVAVVGDGSLTGGVALEALLPAVSYLSPAASMNGHAADHGEFPLLRMPGSAIVLACER